MERLARVVFLISLFFLISLNGCSSGAENRLLGAITNTGWQFESYTMMGWVKVSDQPLPPKELTLLAKKTLVELRANPEPSIEWTETAGNKSLHQLAKSGTGALVELALRSSNIEAARGTYMVVLVRVTQNPKSYLSSRQNLVNLLSTYQEKPTVACTFDLSKPGRLSTSQKRSLLQKIFFQTRSAYIEGVETEDLVSWSGYSKYLPESLVVGQHKLNINTAITYADTEAKTHVLIGSPVITSEY